MSEKDDLIKYKPYQRGIIFPCSPPGIVGRIRNKKDDKGFFRHWERECLNYAIKHKHFTKEKLARFFSKKYGFESKLYIDILFDDLIKRNNVKKVSRKGYMWHKKY